MSGVIKYQQQQKNHGNSNKHKGTPWKNPASCFTSQNESSLKDFGERLENGQAVE